MQQPSPRQRFLNYVKGLTGARPVVSPFLPDTQVVKDTLQFLNQPITGDFIKNEIHLSQILDYEPMFMTEMAGLIFPWKADVIETIAPPPEGDNELAESRNCIDQTICTKGNLNLNLLRDGTPERITVETMNLISAVKGFKHIVSTADAVLAGTPPKNFICFIQTAREALTKV